MAAPVHAIKRATHKPAHRVVKNLRRRHIKCEIIALGGYFNLFVTFWIFGCHESIQRNILPVKDAWSELPAFKPSWANRCMGCSYLSACHGELNPCNSNWKRETCTCTCHGKVINRSSSHIPEHIVFTVTFNVASYTVAPSFARIEIESIRF